MGIETARDYLAGCPHKTDCGNVICSPWGFVSTPELREESKFLIVGLNDNRSKEGDLPEELQRRDTYSDYFKNVIKKEIEEERPQHISNLIPPIARFLLGNDTKDSQEKALQRTELCNVISCCPRPTLDGVVAPASNPSNIMKKNCGSRLQNDEEGAGHELLHRLLRFKPTHVLVLGGDAKDLWKKADHPEKSLFATLNQISRPKVIFVNHPSQRSLTREKYMDQVYQEITKSDQTLQLPDGMG